MYRPANLAPWKQKDCKTPAEVIGGRNGSAFKGLACALNVGFDKNHHPDHTADNGSTAEKGETDKKPVQSILPLPSQAQAQVTFGNMFFVIDHGGLPQQNRIL